MPAPEAYEVAPVDLDQDWDRFVDTALGGTPFVRGAWLRCAEEAGAGQAVVRGAYLKGSLVAAVVGLHTEQRVRRLATPPLVPHSGFLFRPPPSDQLPRQEADRNNAWQALLGHLSGYQHLHLSCAPGVTDVREALWAGWQAHPRYTYWLDLPRDRRQVWDGFERRTRTVIRKAEGAGFHVEETRDVARFVDLYRRTYGDVEPPVAPQTAGRFVAAALTAGLVKGHQVLSPQGDVASIVYFCRADVEGSPRLYAWSAGADPAFREGGATALLYWKVLAATPATVFDFAGANMASIALFKRGFGGRLVGYFALERWNDRWRRWAASWRRG